MGPVPQTQRQQLFTNLLEVLRPSSGGNDSTCGAFAACESIAPSQGFSLTSFHVEGAGEFQLPLAAEDTSRLRGICKRASFGGSDNQNDVTVRHCWQVDASNLSFPGMPTFLSSTIQTLASGAVGALGLCGAGMQFDAQLYKLLLYEAGGHFSFHRDTEKEKGVFAMLILQLPTEEGYEGGEFVVKHSYGLERLDCHMVSRIGFGSMVFSADCLLKLRKVEFGTKLCLAFSLVNRDFSLDRARIEFVSDQVRKVESALEPWMQEATEGKLDIYGEKLAIPLDHQYDEFELRFAKLKGNDRIVAEVLKSCTDKNKEQSLDLHLCLAYKYEEGDALPCNYCDHDCMDPDHYWMESVAMTIIDFSDMIKLNGDRSSAKVFGNLSVDMESELVSDRGDPFDSESVVTTFDRPEVVNDGEDPFDSEPVVRTFHRTRRLQYRYDRALLIAWPKALFIPNVCEGGVAGALGLSETEQGAPKFGEQVRQFLRYSEKYYYKVWGITEDWSYDSVTPRLLRLCARSDMLEVMVNIFQLLSKNLYPSFYVNSTGACYKVGVRNAEVAKEVAAAVQVHGWESLSSAVIQLTKACALTQGEAFAQLAEQLMRTGSIEAGALVASTTFETFEARIAELESHEIPEFTWCQPLARLSWYGDIEKFLQGPEERYVQRRFDNLRLARNFADNYFNIRQWAEYSGYSAIAIPGVMGTDAFCDIQKTGHVFKATMDQCIRKQKETKGLRLQLGKLMSTVFDSSILNVNQISHPSDQPGSKRRRLETEDTEEEMQRPANSTAEAVGRLNYLDEM